MAKYSKGAGERVEDAMHEMKEGDLKTGTGKKVTNPKQAIAIGLSEARESGEKVPVKKQRGAAGKAPAKKGAGSKASPKKAASKKAAAKKATPGKASAKKPAGKTTAKKTPAKKKSSTASSKKK